MTEDEKRIHDDLLNQGFMFRDRCVRIERGNALKTLTVYLELYPEGVNYDTISKLVPYFQTTKISFETEQRNDGWCETCSYYYGVLILRIEGAVL